MVQFVGNFEELANGLPPGPSLRAVIRDWPADHEVDVIPYLERGSVLVTSGQLVDDVLEPTNTDVAPQDLRTDGEWIWPGDLAYYVERYHVELPQAFVHHAASLGWHPPELDVDQLMDVAAVLRPD